MTWQDLLITLAATLLVGAIGLLIWWRRSARTRTEALAHLRSLGIEIVLLPGRLRRMAADERVPPRTRWWMVGLAVCIASPIDLIPDFIPVIGFADELVIVPLALWHIRRMIPAEVWAEYFPPHGRQIASDDTDQHLGWPFPHPLRPLFDRIEANRAIQPNRVLVLGVDRELDRFDTNRAQTLNPPEQQPAAQTAAAIFP